MVCGLGLGLALGLALGMLAEGSSRADKTVTLSGEVPTTGPDHFFLPFDVPAGYRELEVRGDDLSPDNILDFGLYDPSAAGFRGWGGGSTEPAIVGEKSASRGYVPGPITAGTWRVVVGKALVRATPARYRVEITLREQPTLAEQSERTPYLPSPPLRRERRYYAGDFHVHSRESTDARPNVDEILRFAKSRGLDFVVITDHNTVTQDDFFIAAQKKSPDVLLIPGIEVTTYAGHMNAIGATRFVEHKVDQPGESIQKTVQAIHDQGALLALNHPLLDLGDSCIGCAFRHPLDKLPLDAIEVATGGLQQGGLLFSTRVLRLWDDLNNTGRRVAAIGGSDDHQAGQGKGGTQSPIGDPTTLVLADELSAAAILDGVRHGSTVVKLQGPGDPMIELGAGSALPGSLLVYADGQTVTARITGSSRLPTDQSVSARFVKGGGALDTVPVDSDPFVLTHTLVGHPDGRPTFLRAEVLVDGVVHTVSSPIYLSPEPLHIHPPAPDGCACALTARLQPGAATQRIVGLAFLGAGYILARLRIRRRARREN